MKTPANTDTLSSREREYIATVRVAINHGDVTAVRWHTAAFTGYRAAIREELWAEALLTWLGRVGAVRGAA